MAVEISDIDTSEHNCRSIPLHMTTKFYLENEAVEILSQPLLLKMFTFFLSSLSSLLFRYLKVHFSLVQLLSNINRVYLIRVYSISGRCLVIHCQRYNRYLFCELGSTRKVCAT